MKHKLLLFFVVLLAFLLRVVDVDKNPPSLSWDEVSIGYNAYSILKTGRDEHGKFLPLDAFFAYGDYKPPAAIYLTVPSVAVFGLNELAVRFPSVFLGTLTIFIFYFLVHELFGEKILEIKNYKLKIATIATILMAISPWHIQLSRAGWEANIALFFVTLGAYLMLRAREKTWLWIVAFLPFIGSIYTFNSARYFAPVFALALLIYCRVHAIKNKKNIVLGIVISTLALLPILPHIFSPQSRLRFAEVSIFTELSVIETANKRTATDGNAWWAKALHNRRLAYAKNYLTHFLDHFEPWFLFLRGDGNPKFSTQDVGQMYLVEAPLLLAGAYALALHSPRVFILLLFWIFAAIAPAAVARQTPHALRIENSLPAWLTFIAYGIVSIQSGIKRSKVKALVLSLIALGYVANAFYFFHGYATHYAREYSGEWQYGYKEAVSYVESVKDRYDNVVMTDRLGRPYMYVLFYSRFNPAYYQKIYKNESTDAAGFYHNDGFGQYSFVVESPADFKGNTLYVLRPNRVPENARVLKTVRLLNGEPTLVIFTI